MPHSVARTSFGKTKDDRCVDNEDPTAVYPDSPLRERALCQYAQVENTSPKRIPERVSEVECLCSQPKLKRRLPGVRCMSMHYNITVLLFDDNCETFTTTTQSVPMACLPVFSGLEYAPINLFIGRPMAPSIQF
ncbi:Protein C44B12.6 [Aphelenchoides avenae]|nr:Protein C44B12.6 [Aphelenchus avenae]